MTTITETEINTTVGQIVANNFRTAEVFKKYQIDFCCKGNRPLKLVCDEQKLDFKGIVNELAEKISLHIPRTEDSLSNLPLSDLAMHIETTHHQYVRESIPVLLSFLAKISKVHGKKHPELNEVFMLFVDCAENLTWHMVKEETILFPAVRRLSEADRKREIIETPFFFGALIAPISGMQDEHAIEGARFSRIAELCNNFNPPEDACTTYKVAYMKLNEFMNDLFLHVHLENNILFPKALRLEEKIVMPNDHRHKN
jgi:regulator of cell morphogenesis and NO signaling